MANEVAGACFMHWTMTGSECAAWVQTWGSLMGIAAVVALVVWQGRTIHRHATSEEVRRLLILASAAFYCRVAVERYIAANRYDKLGSVNRRRIDLLRHQATFEALPLLEIPDWRVAQAVTSAVAYLQNFDRQVSSSAAPTEQSSREAEATNLLGQIQALEHTVNWSLKDRRAEASSEPLTIDGETFHPIGKVAAARQVRTAESTRPPA